MSTVIACHQAQEKVCDCICGGRLHGCGSSEEAVTRNTELLLGEEEVQAWRERHGHSEAEGFEVRRTDPVLL